jgi:hypothetical protein
MGGARLHRLDCALAPLQYCAMPKPLPPLPVFQPQMLKNGRWFVAVKTGHGPDSHVGDFDTEEQAQTLDRD